MYQFRFRDEDNRVVRREEANFADDAAALVWGEKLRTIHLGRCEIWQGDRLVGEVGRPN